MSAAKLLHANTSRKGCTHHIPSSGTVWVSGDLHDNPFNLSKIIKVADLVTSSNHLVLQEIIHPSGETGRPDLSFRMLVRVASLVISFPEQVHPILANHELSQATNRAITKGGSELVGKFLSGVEHVFGKNTSKVIEAINTFIFAMPLAVQSESGLMCCHSLPDDDDMELFDTNILHRELTEKDTMNRSGSACMLVWGRRQSDKQINALAQTWGVKLFCLGHAWVPEGIEMASEKVLLLNSDHANGVVMPVDLSAIKNAGTTMQSAIKLSSIAMDINEC
ncbi:MAG TPA: hypothetical protein EYO40_08970 [Phycisphaerales bacterium]|nr:hypothetical protein [Phycisphaerales bacterium]